MSGYGYDNKKHYYPKKNYFCDYISKKDRYCNRAFFSNANEMYDFAKNIKKSKKYSLGMYGFGNGNIPYIKNKKY